LELIGHGAFANVYKGKSPGTVIKVMETNNASDPYIKFINIAHHNQHNLFFPRIYSAKIVEQQIPTTSYNSESVFVFIVQMEKLVPLTHSRLKEVTPYLMSQIGIRDHSDGAGLSLDFALDRLFSSRALRREMEKSATNNDFKQALRALDGLFNSSHVDVKTANIMVRLTSKGPQLVLTDPVAPSYFIEM